ncbi:MAG: hypothetical protein IJJ33_01100, partial [Victivallales bacterium]|nr:hypothetical protein [Victivallales bacterium]
MQIDFRIDWGYQYLYSRRHYHPIYVWDGELTCQNGQIQKCRQLDYPVIWYGPGHCAKETPLPEPRWQSRTRRGLAGLRVIADVEDNAVFNLQTASCSLSFTVAELLENGRLVYPVGPKYLGCNVIVTRTGHFWFRQKPHPGEVVWEADDLGLPCHDWARMRTAWLGPGETLEWDVELPANKGVWVERLLHIIAMAAPEYTPGAEKQVHAHCPLTLRCDGEQVAQVTWFFRNHDHFMQLLEDVWLRFQATSGKHRLALTNGHPQFWLLLNRLTLRSCAYRHRQLSLPRWCLAGQKQTGRVFAAYPDTTLIVWPGGNREMNIEPGWNEFEFSLETPEQAAHIYSEEDSGDVAVYALPEEAIPVKVGFDMTVVPHDNSGFMDWLLDYTWRTQLGNMVVFRSFLYEPPFAFGHRDVPDNLLERWADFCRRHGIWVEAATDYQSGALVKAAGESLHAVGRHEYPGAVYAFDPKEPHASHDMREAMEHYLTWLRKSIDEARQVAPGKTAFGDASGGHRYCYLAGVDYERTETMVPHTQHLCSQARPAAESLGHGEWGVHIAIQHAVQPYFENHLNLYFLSLYQPWMMGANFLYEEDSLFLLFKEERQCWDDFATKGKRDMTRDFFRFAKTHPRKGRNVRRIAFLEGRYAAPFNGFICDVEQTPDYSVWGLFGNNSPAWGHRQPEKCRQLLDVLMPGASTLPLRQQYDKRRFFFSGTPYGDFDEVPVEASAQYLSHYQLLLNLGWNTMIQEDHDKLLDYVKGGGTLFTGLPQFSTHVRREFLLDMEDLALWNNGDLTELCGVKVKRPGVLYSGQWNCPDRELMPEPSLSAAPSHSRDEDGPCRLADLELAGAKVVAWDAMTGAPLLVCHEVGKGRVYLLTAWAYPGHEELQALSASWLTFLAV